MMMPSIFGRDMFDDFFDAPFGFRGTHNSGEQMRTDIKDSGNSYEITMNMPGVKKEDVKAELKDLFAMADLVISRAGANAICELLALKKPNILIPLPASSSRGDQLLNAKSFESQGFSLVINEDDLTTELLLDRVHELYFSRQTFRNAMSDSGQMDSVRTIVRLIENL